MLGTLDQLLAQLFTPSALASDERLHPAVAAVGRGCAGAIEQYCDRSFPFADNRVEEFAADCLFIALRAAPLFKLNAVEIAADWGEEGDLEGSKDSATWGDARSTVAMLDRRAGLIHFKTMPGDEAQRIRISYSGGFWIDPSPDRGGTPPEGQRALPDDIFLAWCQLTQEVWTKHQQTLLSTPESNLAPRPTEFPAIVRDLLLQHRRIAA